MREFKLGNVVSFKNPLTNSWLYGLVAEPVLSHTAYEVPVFTGLLAGVA